MKKGILLIFVLSLSLLSKAQTTLEEWNYVTKGYQIQIESGLDMKKGYMITNNGSYTFNSSDAVRIVNFKRLTRISRNEVCAIIVEYIRKSKSQVTVRYFCIPQKTSSAEIWNLCNLQTESFDSPQIGIAFTQALFRFISNNNL